MRDSGPWPAAVATNTLELKRPRLTGLLGPWIERSLRQSTPTAMAAAKELLELELTKSD
jgi:hypothetical protein